MCNNRLAKRVRFRAISNCEDNKKHQEYQYIYLYKKARSIAHVLPAHIRHSHGESIILLFQTSISQAKRSHMCHCHRRPLSP